MKVTILHPANHDGQRHAPGDTVDLPKADAAALIACGSAETPAEAAAEEKPEAKTRPARADRCSQKT